MRATEVSRRGEAAGGAQQMVHPSLPHQRSRPEEDGRHLGQGDRHHFTEAARHLEEKSLSDGQRRTPQLLKVLTSGSQLEMQRRVFFFFMCVRK